MSNKNDVVNMTVGNALTGFFVTVFGVTLAFLMVTLMMLVNAFVLIRLWAWFLPAIFPTVPLLTYPTAMGISLIAGMFRGKTEIKDDHSWKSITIALLLPFFTLGVGYIVKMFI